jgi:hypothetical protein
MKSDVYYGFMMAWPGALQSRTVSTHVVPRRQLLAEMERALSADVVLIECVARSGAEPDVRAALAVRAATWIPRCDGAVLREPASGEARALFGVFEKNPADYPQLFITSTLSEATVAVTHLFLQGAQSVRVNARSVDPEYACWAVFSELTRHIFSDVDMPEPVLRPAKKFSSRRASSLSARPARRRRALPSAPT